MFRVVGSPTSPVVANLARERYAFSRAFQPIQQLGLLRDVQRVERCDFARLDRALNLKTVTQTKPSLESAQRWKVRHQR
jgi:hypothetical protein